MLLYSFNPNRVDMPKQFITPASEFNPENLIFSQIKDTSYGSKFIYINYDNGVDQGPLLLHMENYFCFGVDGNYAPNDKQKTAILGYKIPIPLWSNSAPQTEAQTNFYNVLNAVANKCAEHLSKPETRKLLRKPELTKEFILPKFMPLWFKRNEDYEIEEGTAPVLYAKLRTKGESPDFVITTPFQDSEGNEVDPLTLQGKKFPIDALIKIESIFVGTQPKLQMKLEQVMVYVKDDNDMPSIFKGPPMKKRKIDAEEELLEAEEQEEVEAENNAQEEAEAEEGAEEEMPLFNAPPTPASSPTPEFVGTESSGAKRKRKAL